MIAPPHMVKGFSFLLVCSGTKEKRFLEENGLNVKFAFVGLREFWILQCLLMRFKGWRRVDGFIL